MKINFILNLLNAILTLIKNLKKRPPVSSSNYN